MQAALLGEASLLIRKHDHFTPAREIRPNVRALARNHPIGWNLLIVVVGVLIILILILVLVLVLLDLHWLRARDVRLARIETKIWSS